MEKSLVKWAPGLNQVRKLMQAAWLTWRKIYHTNFSSIWISIIIVSSNALATGHYLKHLLPDLLTNIYVIFGSSLVPSCEFSMVLSWDIYTWQVFQFSTDLDQTWYANWGSQKRTAHHLWRKACKHGIPTYKNTVKLNLHSLKNEIFLTYHLGKKNQSFSNALPPTTVWPPRPGIIATPADVPPTRIGSVITF